MSAEVAVVLFPGTNCEHDVVAGVQRAGGSARIVWHGDRDLGSPDAVIIPGGFAHGDYLRPGAIARFSPVMSAVEDFAAAGGPVVGICNGFQVLTEAQLLPGALQKNKGLGFICAPAELEVASDRSVLTRGIAVGTRLHIPINHFEGNYICDAATLARLEGDGRIVLRYVDNPNGSVASIAGIASKEGNVVGLMPHPERATDALLGSDDGLVLLRALLAAARGTGREPGVTTVPLHRALGLTDEEAEAIVTLLGREPNHLELALYAVMWSEHCSYKSSKVHLRRLPTEGPQVLVGPGENAGVVDAGGGLAVAIRIESHNHPSAIEPYQGAATGVGGILRDIFTMGARPIAIMDPLRFGPLSDARSRWIAGGVVDGISGYGNAVGVPTVGGETVFDDSYTGNPLVNVLCCGVLPADRLVLGAAHGEGNLAVLLGSATGRDGIGGVSVLASAGFTDDAEAEEAKRPNVQVGDPFEEKRLIEACLELLDQHLVVGIQDLGGAGLACATSETASRGGVGMDVDVTAVHRREPGMEAWEVMTSESQERMLAIVTPANLDRVLACCARWEVRASVIGRVTDSGRLRILDGWEGEVLADVPASTLHDDAPVYNRPLQRPADLDARQADDPGGPGGAGVPDARGGAGSPGGLPAPADCGADLLALLVDTQWVWRRYDHQLFLNTVEGPGGDAALLRLAAPGVPTDRAAGEPPRGLALSTDGNGRWCALDPRLGTAMVVAESALNVACVGATPVALVNCLNFGNPEHPEVMWQLSEAIDGMTEACRALDIPVIGGNVSLYNESQGRDIDPTPVVGTLGLVDAIRRRPPGARLVDGQRIVLVHPAPGSAASPHGGVSLAGSRWAVELHGHRNGRLAPLDLAAHGRLVQLVAALVADGVAGGVHDVSEGGLGVALAEMARRGGCGFRVSGVAGSGVADHVGLFGEGPSRVLVSVDAGEAFDGLAARVEQAGLGLTVLGTAGGDRLVVDGLLDLALEDAVSAADGVLPAALGPSSH